MGVFPSNGYDYKCPKCGCQTIHTWLIAICYECNYEGQRLDFANNELTREHELKFKKEIPKLQDRFKQMRDLQ